jgi:hypothetical protein
MFTPSPGSQNETDVTLLLLPRSFFLLAEQGF